jgi:hypothetical protein
MSTTVSTLTEDQVWEILDAVELDESDFVADYSGRGMYGAKCVGFVLSDDTAMLKLGAALQAALGEIPNASTDSMGRNTIVYFPGLTADVPVVDEDEVAAR